MNKQKKLLERFEKLPKDFTFEEIIRLFAAYGFVLNHKGATSGSRVEFINQDLDLSYIMHRPHPKNIVKGYCMRQIKYFIENNNLKTKDNGDPKI